MPRPKLLSDAEVLAGTYALLHEAGPEALTFARAAAATGLSASTLVQRFATKAGLMQATLLHAWDRLDAKTARLAATSPKTPRGAVELLVGLSGDYGGVEAYAEGLLILREDIRDPVLRARGTAWRRALSAALDERFQAVPAAPPAIGLLLATHWQGSLLWWSFDPRGTVEHYVAESLERFIAAVAPDKASGAKAGKRRK
mgnify:CR=1 FL=1